MSQQSTKLWPLFHAQLLAHFHANWQKNEINCHDCNFWQPGQKKLMSQKIQQSTQAVKSSHWDANGCTNCLFTEPSVVKCSMESLHKRNVFWNSFEGHQGTFRALRITWYLDYFLDSKVYELCPILRLEGKVFPDIALINSQHYNIKVDSVYQRLIKAYLIKSF